MIAFLTWVLGGFWRTIGLGLLIGVTLSGLAEIVKPIVATIRRTKRLQPSDDGA